MKQPTKKHLRFSFSCTCGYNSVDDTGAKVTTTHRQLIEVGFKRRKFSNGEVYYLSATNVSCDGTIDHNSED